MEKLKALNEVLKPDIRNSLFVRFDTLTPTALEEHYAEIAAVMISADVPEHGVNILPSRVAMRF
jgi:hypothetical protein